MKHLAKALSLLTLLGWIISLTVSAYSEDNELRLKLIWRQRLEALPKHVPPIFVKPSIINSSFVVRNVMQQGQLLTFDANGVLSKITKVGVEAMLGTSPAHQAFVIADPQTDAVPPEADDLPSTVTGLIGDQSVWQRTSAASTTTVISDDGFSVDLIETIGQLRFYDSQGQLLKSVLPFGSLLPWSQEHPTVGVFSADGSTFALLATSPESLPDDPVTLFLYDRQGRLKFVQKLKDLQLAVAVAVSDQGDHTLAIGWTVDPISEVGMANSVLIDNAGTLLQHFTLPSIGSKISIAFDLGKQEFVIDTNDGAVVRTGAHTSPQIYVLGSNTEATAVATNAGLTAIVSLLPPEREGDDREDVPRGPQHSQADREEHAPDRFKLQLTILDDRGQLRFKRILDPNSKALEPFVALSPDRRFVAVRFAEEIHYYQIRSTEDDDE